MRGGCRRFVVPRRAVLVNGLINSTPVTSASIVWGCVLTVDGRQEDEIHIRTLLSKAMESQPFSLLSLTSKDTDGEAPRKWVVAMVRMHPKDQARLEGMASRISMEHGVSSISWSAAEVEVASQ